MTILGIHPAAGVIVDVSSQTVQATYITRDTDLLAVTLRTTTSTTTPTTSTTSTPTKAQQVAVASHGSQAPPPPPTATRASTRTASTRDETIRTTANHPWLTADRGWAQAGSLTLGERMVRADGSTAVVVAVRAVAGTAPMYDLTVATLHDFAVGSGAYVVHNCGGGGEGEPPSGRNIVYRGLAAGDDPAQGLVARNAGAGDVSPASHIAGKRASPWISTSRSFAVASGQFGRHGVVAIDLSLVDSTVVDLSNGIPGRGGQMISNWAARFQEVLISQRVPARAIVWSRMS